MRIEFPDVYNELHADAKTHYKFQLKTKKQEIDLLMKEEESKNILA